MKTIIYLTVVFSIMVTSNDKKKEISEWDKYTSEGQSYFEDKKYDEAITAYKKAIEIAENNYGKTHDLVAKSLHNLLVVYRASGKYIEGEAIAKRIIEIDRINYGNQHEYAASGLNNLAEIYREQKKYSEAEPLYKEALAVEEKIFGKTHINIAVTYNNLGCLYRDRQEFPKAEENLNKALEIKQKLYGAEGTELAITLQNLAETYEMQNKYKDAIVFYRRTVDIEKKYLGYDRPERVPELEKLVSLYEKLGELDEKKNIEERLEILKKNLPVIESINKLKRYRNKIFDFSVLLPEDWILKENVAGFSLVALNKLEEPEFGFRENISIAVFKSSPDESLEHHEKLNLASMKKNLKNLEILQQEDIEINGLKAKMVVYSCSYPYSDTEIIEGQEVLFFTKKGDTLYIIKGCAKQSDFDAYFILFKKIGYSLEIPRM